MKLNEFSKIKWLVRGRFRNNAKLSLILKPTTLTQCSEWPIIHSHLPPTKVRSTAHGVMKCHMIVFIVKSMATLSIYKIYCT